MRLPNTRLQNILEGITLGLLILEFVLAFVSIALLPGQIPTHFSVSGEVDGYGSKWTLLLLPVVTLLIAPPIWLVIHRVDPRNWNLPFSVPPGRKGAVYGTVKTMLIALDLEVVLIFFSIELFQLLQMGKALSITVLSLTGVVAVTLIVGTYLAWRRRF